MIKTSKEAAQQLQIAREEMVKGCQDMDNTLFESGMTKMAAVELWMTQLIEKVGDFGIPDF
jgi:hypothetical protein